MPEPSFPQYLDVLAPYVNQVNLIRAGVPKIVSRFYFAPLPSSEAPVEVAWCPGLEGL